MNNLLNLQLKEWELARTNHAALAAVEVRELKVRGIPYLLQHNPARIVSTAARVDKRSVETRPCFLCRANRPHEQRAVRILPGWELLVNPYPILPRHFTIASACHTPQHLDAANIGHLLTLARLMPGSVLLFNGAESGASAPDHLHFQAVEKGHLPIERWRDYGTAAQRCIGAVHFALPDDAPRHSRVLQSDNKDALRDALSALLDLSGHPDADRRCNLLAYYQPEDGRWTVHVFLRKAHRPACYFAEGTDRILCSPGAIDMGGLIVLPRKEDFIKLTAEDLERILEEVCDDLS